MKPIFMLTAFSAMMWNVGTLQKPQTQSSKTLPTRQAAHVKTPIQKPVGYVIRVSTKHQVYHVRSGKRELLDKKRLIRRVDLYPDSDFVFPGRDSKGMPSGYVYFFMGNEVHRDPNQQFVRGKLGSLGPGKKAAKGVLGGRSQGPLKKSSDVIVSDGETTQLIVASNGLAKFSWVSARKTTPESVQFLQGKKVIFQVALGQADLKSAGPVSVLTINVKETPLAKLDKFALKVTWKGDKKPIEAQFERYTGNGRNEAERLSAFFKMLDDDPDWFFAFNDRLHSLEDAGCKAQAGALVLDWFVREPDNHAARFAAEGISTSLNLGTLARYFRSVKK